MASKKGKHELIRLVSKVDGKETGSYYVIKKNLAKSSGKIKPIRKYDRCLKKHVEMTETKCSH